MFRFVTAFAAALLAAVGPACAGTPPVIELGSGSYYASLPVGAPRPGTSSVLSTSPRVSPGFSGPTATNEFWSSWIYEWNQGNQLGSLIHPHPLMVRALNRGLAINYTPFPTVTSRAYSHNLNVSTTLVAVMLEPEAAE